MPDHQQIIDEIRFHLQSEHCELTDDIRELAAAYAVVCREVNARLRRCGEYLRQDLRSEAIHFADAEPNLLDLVTTIDFPEREHWNEIVAIYDLPKTEPLLLTVAEQLNEAYAIEQPLQRLLGRHRMLAISQAPLSQRLTVMRKLQGLDPTSAFWSDDIRTFETTRLQQISEEAREAASVQDHATLVSLVEEVESKEWCNTPSRKLIGFVKQAAGSVTRTESRKLLAKLEVKLNDALLALDVGAGRAARDRWNLAARTAQLPQNDPLNERVEPVFDWLDDEDNKEASTREYEDVVVRIERALTNDASLDQLLKLGQAADATGQPLLEPLANRYRNHLQNRQLQTKRKNRVIVGGVAIVVVGAVITLGLFLWSLKTEKEIERIATAVGEMLDDHQLDSARELVDSQPVLNESSTGLAVLKRLVDEEEQDTERKRLLSETLATAETTNEFDEAMAALGQAREYVITAEEKAKVSALQRNREQRQSDHLLKLEKEFRQGIYQAGTTVTKLESLIETPARWATFDNRMREAHKTIGRMQQDLPNVSQELKQQFKFIVSRVETLTTLRRKLEIKYSLEQQLTEQSQFNVNEIGAERSLGKYVQTLKEYSEQLPKDSRTQQFNRVLAEEQAWRAVIRWGELTKKWGTLEVPTIHAAKSRLMQLKEFSDANQLNPNSDVSSEYTKYLSAIVRREKDPENGREGIRSKLTKMFRSPLIKDTFMLESKSDQRFYFSTEVQVFGFGSSLKYLTNPSGETRTMTFQSNNLKFTKSRVAPQSIIAGKVIKEERDVKVDNWESFTKTIVGLLLKQTDVDPYLRYILLQQVVQYSKAGSYALNVELPSHTGPLDRDDIDLRALWMDPNNAAAEIDRKKANDALIELKDLQDAWKQVEKHNKTLADRLFTKGRVVGWMSVGAKGGWICRTKWKPNGQYTLRVPVLLESGPSAVWRTIGGADDRGMELRNADKELLQEGRLIFAFPAAASKKVAASP